MRIKAIGARKEIRLRKNYGEPWAPARPAKKSKIEVRLSSFIRHSPAADFVIHSRNVYIHA